MPGKPPTLQAAPVLRIERGWRVFVFYSGALVLTGLVSLIFADLLWRTGWSAARTVLLALFVVLFLFTAIGCMHGLYGFFLRMTGDRRRITKLKEYRDQNIDGISTAIIFPIYNEDVVRVYEGLRATYQSLEKTGQLDKAIAVLQEAIKVLPDNATLKEILQKLETVQRQQPMQLPPPTLNR